MYSIFDICNEFFYIEEKYNLNYQKMHGCYPWQLIRMYLYFEITRSTQIMGSGHPQSISNIDKFKSFLPFLKNSILHNPFNNKNHKDILIFDHPRKAIYENEYVDIYSHFLINFLDGKYEFEVMEAPYFNRHLTEKKEYVKYTDRIELGSYIYKKTHKINFTDDEKQLILNVQQELENKFKININLFKIFEMHILNFTHDYKKYKELFLKKKPKIIFVVVAYENKAMVAAAKELGITVIELQHGTINTYHLGYSYPKGSRALGDIAYFPDKILTFGDYWINEDYCPISKKNIIPIGFPYFENQTKEYIDMTPNITQILFISQGGIDELTQIAYELANACPNYKIIYKLHPEEYGAWRDNYPYLVKGDELDNFLVIDNGETPLYQFFGESAYMVGVCSTAIYEGLMFNCKTFVVNLPCIEYMMDLIEDNIVCKINDVDELIVKLTTFNPKEYNRQFFFENFDETLLKKVIDNE